MGFLARVRILCSPGNLNHMEVLACAGVVGMVSSIIHVHNMELGSVHACIELEGNTFLY